AKMLGDVLVVGINSDRSARRLKGKHRPINTEQDRMALVAALEPVDYVVLFDEDTPVEAIRALRPDVHVKGGDYAGQELPEAEAVREGGGRVEIVPLIGRQSTSDVIDRILHLAALPQRNGMVEVPTAMGVER
ncbi:MAG: ADP-heptose synthase / D-glycero-beta-D-manno-heptose 7-phosphate kinase, partial [uncultured Chloroflexia bacterium]